MSQAMDGINPDVYEESARSCVMPSDYFEVLGGPEGEDIRLAVKRGSAWLAEQEPAWAEMIVEAVENERFDLSCYGNCAVGTVLGRYTDHFSDQAPEAQENGFWIYERKGIDNNVLWAAVEQAWVDIAHDEVNEI